jgi:hypothetical protein
VKYVDPDGEDIVLLNRSYGAFYEGHNAVVVGNDKDGWILYSKDGLNVNTRNPYKTFDEFLNENKAAKREDRYDRAARLETTANQDKAMQDQGDKIYNRKYSVWEKSGKGGETTKQNCADLVADIISSAGSVKIDKPKIRIETEITINTGITGPNIQIKDFARNNKTENFLLP